MKTTKLLLSVLLLCGFLPLSAQNNATDVSSYAPRDWTIIPPSPEVASLHKFVTIPISPFTGQPNIDLPIYTLREGTIEIPISIKYHGGGIKVDENAGIIGLGWSLNAGGSISRSMYGFPDELTGSNYTPKGIFDLDYNTEQVRQGMIRRSTNDESSYNDYLKYFTIAQCEKLDQGLRDVSNDVFHINCLGHTGTFIYEPHGLRKMILSTPSPIKFSDNYTSTTKSNISPFEFYDVSGLKYEFNSTNVDSTKLYYRRQNSNSELDDSILYVSAWHISKVISLTGDTVEFKYIRDKNRHYTLGTSYYQSKSNNENIAKSGSSVSSSTVHYHARIISEIITRSTIAVFSYSEDKETLKSISIHRNNTNRDLIKKFVFNQEDFTIWDKTRKQLKEVIEYGSNNTDFIKLYGFSYSSGDYGSNNANLAQDEWGYFNGATNSTLVYNSTDNVDNISIADRAPNLRYTEAGVLISIKYPTGGSTEFEWEQNDYSYIKQSVIPQDESIKEVVSEDTLRGNAYNRITEYNLYNTDKSLQIKINGDTPFLTIDCSRYIEPFASVFPWSEYYRTHYNTETTIMNLPRIEIRDSQNRLLKYWYIDHATSTSTNISYLSYTFPQKGDYKIFLCDPTNFKDVSAQIINGYFGDGAEVDSSLGFVRFTLSQKYSIPATNKKPWGGLRIASIKSNAGTNTTYYSGTISKKYRYSKSNNDSDFSSGTIQELPHYNSRSYHFKSSMQMPNSGSTIASAEIDGYHSNGLYSTPCGGSQIEYPYVWEIYPNDNTSVRYSYSSLRNIDNTDYVDAILYDWIPGGSRMNTSYSHKRGNLLSTEYYSNGFLYKTEEYDTRILQRASDSTFTGNLFRVYSMAVPEITGEDGSWLSSNYAVCRYKLIQYNKNPLSIITTEFGSTSDLTDSVYFSYFNSEYNDNPESVLPRSKSTINSKGEIETTYYTYLKSPSNHAINFPETEVTVCGNNIICAKKIVYDNKYHIIATYTSAPGLTIKSSYSLGNDFFATDALKNDINIPGYSYRYNNDGNIVEISYNDIVLASYIWGYQGSHPIAEIKNVSYNDVCNTLPTSLHPDVLSNSNNITEANLNSIRGYFPGKEILTMNYHWLIGVASTIDSRGIPTRYNYDSFGRIDNVKDYNNYFIKKYSYNYVTD